MANDKNENQNQNQNQNRNYTTALYIFNNVLGLRETQDFERVAAYQIKNFGAVLRAQDRLDFITALQSYLSDGFEKKNTTVSDSVWITTRLDRTFWDGIKYFMDNLSTDAWEELKQEMLTALNTVDKNSLVNQAAKEATIGYILTSFFESIKKTFQSLFSRPVVAPSSELKVFKELNEANKSKEHLPIDSQQTSPSRSPEHKVEPLTKSVISGEMTTKVNKSAASDKLPTIGQKENTEGSTPEIMRALVQNSPEISNVKPNQEKLAQNPLEISNVKSDQEKLVQIPPKISKFKLDQEKIKNYTENLKEKKEQFLKLKDIVKVRAEELGKRHGADAFQVGNFNDDKDNEAFDTICESEKKMLFSSLCQHHKLGKQKTLDLQEIFDDAYSDGYLKTCNNVEETQSQTYNNL